MRLPRAPLRCASLVVGFLGVGFLGVGFPGVGSPGHWVLLVGEGRAAVGPRGPARLELAPGAVALGRLRRGEARQVGIPWRRAGAGPLRVLAVDTGCGCAAAEGLATCVPEGAAGSLAITVAGRRRAGPFAVDVRIYTDAAPPHDVLRRRLTGWVEAPLALRPTALDLGACSPGARVERSVEVRWALPPPGGLRASLAGLEGRVALVAGTGRSGCLLRLDVRAPQASGPFRGRVLLRGADGVLTALPVRGVVR